MRKVAGILRYTFIEIFRNRVYYVLLLFAGMLILSTLLLGQLGGEQKNRMIIDLGMAGIEAFALAIGVFSSVTLVLQEMESRTLYLILTRPVARYQFVIGRFLGLVALMSLAFAIMAAAHLSLLAALHIRVDSRILLSLVTSWEKVVLITSVGLLFSLFSTSTPSAVTFTLFFWIMGHFSSEIRFLAGRASSSVVAWICKTFYYLAPNFQLMNLKDLPSTHFSGPWLLAVAGYGLAYTAFCLVLTVVLFRRKEF